LLKKGYKVISVDIADPTAQDILNKVTYLNIDIRDKKKLMDAMTRVDYVVHAAAALPIAHDKKLIYSINIDGNENVLECSLKNGIKRLVFISSTAVYGVPKHLPEEENDPIKPIGYYGESKVAGEKLCKKYGTKGLSINIIRPKTFLGPERLGVFTLWFEAIFK